MATGHHTRLGLKKSTKPDGTGGLENAARIGASETHFDIALIFKVLDPRLVGILGF
jgi:hypothetical protein